MFIRDENEDNLDQKLTYDNRDLRSKRSTYTAKEARMTSISTTNVPTPSPDLIPQKVVDFRSTYIHNTQSAKLGRDPVISARGISRYYYIPSLSFHVVNNFRQTENHNTNGEPDVSE